MLSHFTLSKPFLTGTHPDSTSPRSWWFIFAETKILVQSSNSGPPAICEKSPEQLGVKPVFIKYFGRYDDINCFTAYLERSQDLPGDTEFRELRSLFELFDYDVFALAGRAIQIVHWFRDHQFCGRCGNTMADHTKEITRHCPSCGLHSYPRLSPAVIMSVIRDGKILLARSPHFPSGMYSTLAGFVEPGETLEEAVHREVFEEVGITVQNIRYIASQPWPFPHSLMVGFTADYIAGEIKIDGEELVEAAWFAPHELPKLPSKISISRLLIEQYAEKCGTGTIPR
jgi:NAD+ diphosphatase